MSRSRAQSGYPTILYPQARSMNTRSRFGWRVFALTTVIGLLFYLGSHRKLIQFRAVSANDEKMSTASVADASWPKKEGFPYHWLSRESVEHSIKNALNGSSLDASRLGNFYATVVRDDEKAARWRVLASYLGDSEASMRLRVAMEDPGASQAVRDGLKRLADIPSLDPNPFAEKK
jgi:hypothetical protein